MHIIHFADIVLDHRYSCY